MSLCLAFAGLARPCSPSRKSLDRALEPAEIRHMGQ